VAGSTRTLSGWGPAPEGFSRATPQDVLAFQNQIDFPVRRAGALDQGTPGQYYASHAERQAAVLEPNTPITVSSRICVDCEAFFSHLAEYTGVEQQVTDIYGTWHFYP
jgi:hypothetical protein